MVILKLIGYLVNSGLNTWNWGKFVSSRVVGDCKWLNVLCIGCKADWVVCSVFGVKLYVG